eukprot:TRINITY_DN7448_c0_g1_i11.p1 TRINITY_DN7448_c0_g1~~TRINITY_DN7448_c0_g1_i11.p1  ORF type:complete len:836 (-),score=42.50 TRINITY_DN7448_c0_g1_i11:2186-4693(-)
MHNITGIATDPCEIDIGEHNYMQNLRIFVDHERSPEHASVNGISQRQLKKHDSKQFIMQHTHQHKTLLPKRYSIKVAKKDMFSNLMENSVSVTSDSLQQFSEAMNNSKNLDRNHKHMQSDSVSYNPMNQQRNFVNKQKQQPSPDVAVIVSTDNQESQKGSCKEVDTMQYKQNKQRISKAYLQDNIKIKQESKIEACNDRWKQKIRDTQLESTSTTEYKQIQCNQGSLNSYIMQDETTSTTEHDDRDNFFLGTAQDVVLDSYSTNNQTVSTDLRNSSHSLSIVCDNKLCLDVCESSTLDKQRTTNTYFQQPQLQDRQQLQHAQHIETFNYCENLEIDTVDYARTNKESNTNNEVCYEQRILAYNRNYDEQNQNVISQPEVNTIIKRNSNLESCTPEQNCPFYNTGILQKHHNNEQHELVHLPECNKSEFGREFQSQKQHSKTQYQQERIGEMQGNNFGDATLNIGEKSSSQLNVNSDDSDDLSQFSQQFTKQIKHNLAKTNCSHLDQNWGSLLSINPTQNFVHLPRYTISLERELKIYENNRCDDYQQEQQSQYIIDFDVIQQLFKTFIDLLQEKQQKQHHGFVSSVSLNSDFQTSEKSTTLEDDQQVYERKSQGYQKILNKFMEVYNQQNQQQLYKLEEIEEDSVVCSTNNHQLNNKKQQQNIGQRVTQSLSGNFNNNKTFKVTKIPSQLTQFNQNFEEESPGPLYIADYIKNQINRIETASQDTLESSVNSNSVRNRNVQIPEQNKVQKYGAKVQSQIRNYSTKNNIKAKIQNKSRQSQIVQNSSISSRKQCTNYGTNKYTQQIQSQDSLKSRKTSIVQIMVQKYENLEQSDKH